MPANITAFSGSQDGDTYTATFTANDQLSAFLLSVTQPSGVEQDYTLGDFTESDNGDGTYDYELALALHASGFLTLTIDSIAGKDAVPRATAFGVANPRVASIDDFRYLSRLISNAGQTTSIGDGRWYASSAANAFWSGTPDVSLGSGEWLMLMDFDNYESSSPPAYYLSIYTNSNNRIQLYHRGGASDDYTLIVRSGGSNVMSGSGFIRGKFDAAGISSTFLGARRVAIWRVGDTVTLAFYNGDGTAVHELVKYSEDLPSDFDLDTLLGGTWYINSEDGTNSFKRYSGALTVVKPSTTLAACGLSTDEHVRAVMRNHDLVNHLPNVDTVWSFGDLTNGSGEKLEFVARGDLSAGSRLTCPNTGEFLTLDSHGTPTEDMQGFPPHHLVSRFGEITPMFGQNHRGLSDYPVGDGSLAMRSILTREPSGHGACAIQLFDVDTGLAVKPAVLVPHTFPYIDSSESNAQAYTLGMTSIGLPAARPDNHLSAEFEVGSECIGVSLGMHSEYEANVPDTGDSWFASASITLVDGSLRDPVHVQPQTVHDAPYGSAYSGNESEYDEQRYTYPTMARIDGRFVLLAREGTTGDGQLHVTVVNEWDQDGDAVTYQVTAAPPTDWGCPIPNFIIPMSDNRFVLLSSSRLDGSGSLNGLFAVIGTMDGDGALTFTKADGSSFTLGTLSPSDEDCQLYEDNIGVAVADQDHADFTSAIGDGVNQFVAVCGVGDGDADELTGTTDSMHIGRWELVDGALVRRQWVDITATVQAMADATANDADNDFTRRPYLATLRWLDDLGGAIGLALPFFDGAVPVSETDIGADEDIYGYGREIRAMTFAGPSNLAAPTVISDPVFDTAADHGGRFAQVARPRHGTTGRKFGVYATGPANADESVGGNTSFQTVTAAVYSVTSEVAPPGLIVDVAGVSVGKIRAYQTSLDFFGQRELG